MQEIEVLLEKSMRKIKRTERYRIHILCSQKQTQNIGKLLGSTKHLPSLTYKQLPDECEKMFIFLRTNAHRFDKIKFTKTNRSLFLYCENQTLSESINAYFGDNKKHILIDFCEYLENFFDIQIEKIDEKKT